MKSLLAAMFIGAAVLAIAACGGGQAPPPPHPQPPPPLPCALAPQGTASVNLNDCGGKGPFAFEPADLTFSVGETVTLELRSETQFHTFTVEALGIDIDVDGGKTKRLTYTFERAGTYDLICIPHQSLGMVGTITVR